MVERLDSVSFSAHTVGTASDAVHALMRGSFDLILCSSRVHGLEGFPLLPQLVRTSPNVPILLIREEGCEVDAGLLAYLDAEISEPIDQAELNQTLSRLTETIVLKRRMNTLESQLAKSMATPPIVGSSDAMVRLLEGLENAAFGEKPTLLQGEQGTHRESLARALHDLSAQRNKTFLTIQCRAEKSSPSTNAQLTPETSTFQKELHEAVKTSQHGTIYISNIERLSLKQQAELFAVIDDSYTAHAYSHEANIGLRIIASTNVSLETRIQSGDFLKELAQLLEHNFLEVPPLRDRVEDISLLADHWCQHYSKAQGLKPLKITDEAMSHLAAHSWPGNLRELEAVIQLAVSRAKSDLITITEIPLDLLKTSFSRAKSESESFDLKATRQQAEAQTIRRALRQTGGNRTHAAKLLKISHRALLYKLKTYGIRD